jgi:hypothetical protein
MYLPTERDAQNIRITAFWGCIAKRVNIMTTIDIAQKTGPASGEEAAVIAALPYGGEVTADGLCWFEVS